MFYVIFVNPSQKGQLYACKGQWGNGAICWLCSKGLPKTQHFSCLFAILFGFYLTSQSAKLEEKKTFSSTFDSKLNFGFYSYILLNEELFLCIHNIMFIKKSNLNNHMSFLQSISFLFCRTSQHDFYWKCQMQIYLPHVTFLRIIEK